jgi:hypothetical protein
LAQKLLEILELGWRYDLENHSIALAKNHELIAFVESQFIANLSRNDDLSFGSSTTALGPVSPAIQPCLRVLHRRRAHSSGSVLLQIPSTSRSHLLIAVLPNVNAGEFTIARLNVLEINNMTSNLTALEAVMSPELNKNREYCGWNIVA